MSYTPAMPTNNDDVIDSRDVIHWIDALTQEFIDNTDTEPADYMSAEDWKVGLSADDAEALVALIALKNEADSSPDWKYGETLIRDSHFQDYAEELADDIGALDRDFSWPRNHIDWEAAANELKEDYFSVEFDGETYWIRA